MRQTYVVWCLTQHHEMKKDHMSALGFASDFMPAVFVSYILDVALGAL